MRKYLVILFLFTSCTVISNLTISEETKQQQLQDITTQYHRNIYFGSFEQAALKVAAKNKVSFVTKQHNRKKEENLVEIETDKIDFKDKSNTAIVFTKIKYFKKPTYMVTTRVEKETWEFDTYGDGWQLLGSEEVVN
ncbi:MAG: hypothetical protein KBC84_03400 [Proteobacteria bacterium]|nr:hypothetical protein [Pseudomonadota bacterium]